MALASNLFLKGNMDTTQRFMRKVWINTLESPFCVPRNPNYNELDPYGGNTLNCNIFYVDQSGVASWNGSYETYQIAVNRLSINFKTLPTNSEFILITLNNNIKPKNKCLSSSSYPITTNGIFASYDRLNIFTGIFIPPSLKDDSLNLSETLFNIDASNSLSFYTVEIQIRSIEDVQTIELGCYGLDRSKGALKKSKKRSCFIQC